MRDAIAHKVHFLAGNVRVGRREFGVITFDIARCLANDFHVTNHRILYQFVSEKG